MRRINLLLYILLVVVAAFGLSWGWRRYEAMRFKALAQETYDCLSRDWYSMYPENERLLYKVRRAARTGDEKMVASSLEWLGEADKMKSAPVLLYGGGATEEEAFDDARLLAKKLMDGVR